MPTSKQVLGSKGEAAVCTHVACPRCGREKHFKTLPTNFECVDVICKFCGFLAQVKATVRSDAITRPDLVPGAGWRPQHQRIIAGIFHSLYVVSFSESGRLSRIDYVPSHILQAHPGTYQPRKPLSEDAKRAGWQGFVYDLRKIPDIGSQQVYPLPS